MALSQFAESAAAVNRVVLQHCRSHLDAGHSISLAGKFNLVERWILYITLMKYAVLEKLG